MRIGIDATGIWGIKDGLLNGIMRYTIHLINNMLTIDNENEYVIYCRDEIPTQFTIRPSNAEFKVFFSQNRKILQQIRLPRAARQNKINLMFYPYHSASVFCPCTCIATIHDLHPYVVPERFRKIHSHEIHKSAFISRLNRIYWEKILHLTARRMDRLIAVSKATKNDIIRIFKVPSEKIDVVYEGVDSAYFNTGTDGRDLQEFKRARNLPDKYLLSVGTHAYKNVEGVIQAFGLIRTKHPEDIHLVIAGNKNYLSAEIFRLVENLHLKDSITFTGFFPAEELKYLYQCAQVFLFPSFYEGFGLPVLEAFACGTPVVASTQGSLPEVVGESGLLVDPSKSDEIAGAVLSLLSDPRLYEDMQTRGFEQAKRFTWREAALRTLEIFTRT